MPTDSPPSDLTNFARQIAKALEDARWSIFKVRIDLGEDMHVVTGITCHSNGELRTIDAACPRSETR